jgi:hypothetical protein
LLQQQPMNGQAATAGRVEKIAAGGIAGNPTPVDGAGEKWKKRRLKIFPRSAKKSCHGQFRRS